MPLEPHKGRAARKADRAVPGEAPDVAGADAGDKALVPVKPVALRAAVEIAEDSKP